MAGKDILTYRPEEKKAGDSRIFQFLREIWQILEDKKKELYVIFLNLLELQPAWQWAHDRGSN